MQEEARGPTLEIHNSKAHFRYCNDGNLDRVVTSNKGARVGMDSMVWLDTNAQVISMETD